MHPGRRSRGRRVRRAVVVAGFAILVASLAHTVGGGDAPGPLTAVLALLVTLPLAVGLAGRRADWRTALSALVAQTALHLLYSLGLDRPGVVVDAGRSGTHLHHAGPVVIDPDAPALGAHGLMTAGHLLAAVLTIAALVQADRVLDALGRIVASTVRALVPRVPASAPLPPARRIVPADDGFRPANPAVRRRALRHRGPPARAVALG